MLLGLCSEMTRAREKPVLFTHVIFEVGAGPAQQEDACALGVAVLAGQVQGRVPRLGERQEKGGHVSNRLLCRPAGLAEGRYLQKKKGNAHILCFLIGPKRGFSGKNISFRIQIVRVASVTKPWFQVLALPVTRGKPLAKALNSLSFEFLTCKTELEPYMLRL